MANINWVHERKGQNDYFIASCESESDAVHLDAEIYGWLRTIDNGYAMRKLEMVRTMHDRWDRMAMQYPFRRRQEFSVRVHFMDSDADAVQFKLRFC